jgi:hypothetical protein
MRTTILALLGVLAALFVLALSWAPPAEAQDPVAGATFIGGSKCKQCHIKHVRAWTKMKHAKAWDNLPKKYRDPGQKDEDGRSCVSCHVTGFGAADQGGFKDAASSGHLLGVQCEACHGPSSKHRDKAKAAAAAEQDLVAPFLITRKPTNCADCHNPHINYAKKFGAGGGG